MFRYNAASTGFSVHEKLHGCSFRSNFLHSLSKGEISARGKSFFWCVLEYHHVRSVAHFYIHAGQTYKFSFLSHFSPLNLQVRKQKDADWICLSHLYHSSLHIIKLEGLPKMSAWVHVLIFIYGEKFRQKARGGALRERQLNGHLKSGMTLVVFIMLPYFYAASNKMLASSYLQRDAFCNRGISFLTFGSSQKQVN